MIWFEFSGTTDVRDGVGMNCSRVISRTDLRIAEDNVRRLNVHDSRHREETWQFVTRIGTDIIRAVSTYLVLQFSFCVVEVILLIIRIKTTLSIYIHVYASISRKHHEKTLSRRHIQLSKGLGLALLELTSTN